MIPRRDFITLMGGAAVAWPLAARAEQPRRIGVLLAGDPADPAKALGLQIPDRLLARADEVIVTGKMKRRQFITLLGGAAAWPLVARAQQPAMPVVGFLSFQSPGAAAPHLSAYRRGLNEEGYIEGQNVGIEFRWAEGRFDRLPELAGDLVRRRVSVIAAPGSALAALAAKAATTTIPILFGIAEDPVKRGLVASLARPGGNVTGISFFNAELVAKQLGLLRELLPGAVRVVVLVNPADAARAESISQNVEAAARALGLQIAVFNASTAGEIDAVFASLARERADALLIAADPFFYSRRVQLATLAARHMIPSASGGRDGTEAGLLVSYGTSVADMYRRVGDYTGRILKGAKPADLPVEQPTKFELVINLQTAKMLGIDVPPTLLARADEVIE